VLALGNRGDNGDFVTAKDVSYFTILSIVGYCATESRFNKVLLETNVNKLHCVRSVKIKNCYLTY